MSYRRDLYKQHKIGSIDEGRAKRSERLTFTRKEERLKLLENRRGTIFENEETTEIPKPEPPKKKTRAEMLQEWKAEKKKKLDELKKKQKPIFKVGIVHRKITGSPLATITNTFANKNFLNTKQVTNNNSAQGVVTRSRAKALGSDFQTLEKQKAANAFSKIVKNKRKPINHHEFVVPKAVSELPYSQKITIPHSPQITKSSKRSNNKKHILEVSLKRLNLNSTNDENAEKVTPVKAEDKKEVKSLQKNPVKTPVQVAEKKEVKSQQKNPVKVPVQAEEKKEVKSQQKNWVQDAAVPSTSSDYVPIHYSPFVNKTRGSIKKTPRYQRKVCLSMDVDEQVDKEEKEFNCRIFSFRKFVECQTKRLLEACDEWKKVSEESSNLPQDVEGEINSVIGKTKLLTSDKIIQFRDLIDKCEKNDPMIKIDDLQGFQDWVSIEIENLDKCFNKLDERKKNNWVDEKREPAKKVVSKVRKPEDSNKNKPVVKAKGSNIRAHILAARKMMQENATDFRSLQALSTYSEARSPVKKSTPMKKESLIRDVLNSEAKKKIGLFNKTPESRNRSSVISGRRNSGLEMMIAARNSRTLTPTKKEDKKSFSPDSPVIFSNVGVTPAKSILKHSNVPSTSKRSVAFRLSNEVPTPPRISQKYFGPELDTDNEEEGEDAAMLFDSIIDMKDISINDVRTSTPNPVRRSARIANKSLQ